MTIPLLLCLIQSTSTLCSFVTDRDGHIVNMVSLPRQNHSGTILLDGRSKHVSDRFWSKRSPMRLAVLNHPRTLKVVRVKFCVL